MIVDIPVVKTCNCYLCSSGFDTSYPDQLQNHINPDDFRQSIKNINKHFPKSAYCCLCCVAILTIIGLGFLLAGIPILYEGFTNKESKQTRDRIVVGTILIFICMIIWCFSCRRCFCRQQNSFEPFRRAVEAESKKYEAQHCQWRLIRKKDDSSLLLSRRKQGTKFHIIIEINPTNENDPMLPSYSDVCPSSQRGDEAHV